MKLGMLVEKVGPTDDTVLALLDFLVDPLLPSKCLPKDQLSNEDLVAKQVHAVVLLYNYYHRKQKPQLEFLDFLSFSKLAMALKPSLTPYLSFTQSSDCGGGELETDAVDKLMSLTEKAIVNACDVSRSLDASIGKPVVEGWPISRIAVFLVDSKIENCFLLHSSITQGAWSVIEKDVIPPGEEGGRKKSRVVKKTPKEDEAALRQVAYSAVREACVSNLGELKILETHTVYSTSKAKTGARLYIMRCTQLQQEENRVPISDALGSLQGPLVRKESGAWMFTPVVEYFHLLPFADILPNWLERSRENLANGTQPVESSENGNCAGSPLNAEEISSASHNVGTVKSHDNYDNDSHLNENPPSNSSSSQHCEISKAVRNGNGCHSNSETKLHHVSNHSKMARADVATEPLAVYKKRNRSQASVSNDDRSSKKCNGSKPYPNKENERPITSSSRSADDQKQLIVVEEPEQLAFSGDENVVVDDRDTNPRVNITSDNEIQNGAVVSSEQLQKIQLVISSKEELMSETALKVLYRTRDLLSEQHRIITDKIALNERDIAIILKGGEDSLAVKIDSVIKGSIDLCQTSSAPENNTVLGSRPSEANLSSHDPCRELDRICNNNNWSIPTYIVSTVEGEFQSTAIVKGLDFVHSSEGTLSSTPQDSRNSAALLMLAKLQNLQSNIHK